MISNTENKTRGRFLLELYKNIQSMGPVNKVDNVKNVENVGNVKNVDNVDTVLNTVLNSQYIAILAGTGSL